MLDPARDVKKLVEGKVDMTAFAQKVLEKFDGVDGIVALLREEYDAMPAGSKVRHEVLKTILALLERNAAEGVKDADLGIEELEREKALLDRHLAESEAYPGPGEAGGAPGAPAEAAWERDAAEHGEPPY